MPRCRDRLSSWEWVLLCVLSLGLLAALLTSCTRSQLGLGPDDGSWSDSGGLMSSPSSGHGGGK